MSDAERLARQRNAAWAVAAASWLALIVVLVLPRPATAPAQAGDVPDAPGTPPVAATPDETTGPAGGGPAPDTAAGSAAGPSPDAPAPASETEDPAPAGSGSGPKSGVMARLPPDRFTELLRRPDSPEVLNERFLLEETDLAWAEATERKIRDFVARHPYGSSYEFAYLECRSTLCRATIGADSEVLHAIQQVMDNPSPVAGLAHDALGRELESGMEGYSRRPEDPDRTTILLIFERK